jgi:hypothetical protein
MSPSTASVCQPGCRIWLAPLQMVLAEAVDFARKGLAE